MDAWRFAIGTSILGVWLAAACSDSSKPAPSGQSGVSGAAQAGDAAAAGAPGKAGSGAQAGGAGGAGGGGPPVGGSDSGGTLGGGDGGSAGAGAATGGPYQAVLGQVCPVESTIGVVRLMGFPAPYVQVALYDRTDPWIGEAELSTTTCDFHRYTAAGCPECEVGEVCSIATECVPEQRTIKDATLLVKTGAAEREYAADPQLGGIYSTLDIGDADASFAMTLSWGETEVQLAAMPVAGGNLTNVAISTESDDFDMPGALDATWTPSNAGALVRSRIPINHHAGGPTFTECVAPESEGAFHADAAMINPLAVQTGLEFQGLEHVFVAAATTPQGCIEFRFGAQIFAFPN